jgi:hypothetical protein
MLLLIVRAIFTPLPFEAKENNCHCARPRLIFLALFIEGVGENLRVNDERKKKAEVTPITVAAQKCKNAKCI